MGETAAACPKCGTPRESARTNCAKCGLAVAKMESFAKARDDVSDVLVSAWDKTVEKWDDPAQHDALLRLVTQHDAYAWAAARYRDRAGQASQDAIAKEQLERVRKAAEATLLSSAAARKDNAPEPYRHTMAMLAFFVILIVAGLVYMIARGGGGDKVQRERYEQTAPSETK